MSKNFNTGKIKILGNKKLTTVALISLLAIGTFMAILPSVTAHQPPWNIPTYAYIVASPDPVGKDQPVFLIFWLDKVPPTAGGTGGDRWTGFRINVTMPDGKVKKLGPYISDATSAAWDIFTPTQTGTYKFDFAFPGQTASNYHPQTGIAGSGGQYVGDYYMPSTASCTVTVQEIGVVTPPLYDLPSVYWTRPIEGRNTQWTIIGSNYLGGAQIVDKVQPDGAGPNSAHIMWTKPYQPGGIIGGYSWSVPSAAYYTGLSYNGKFNNPLIMYGRLYYDSSFTYSATGGPYTCVDLATGETLWENDAISPTFGYVYLYESMNQHGAVGPYLVQSASGGWRFYDAITGTSAFNMSNVPSGTQVLGPSGEIVIFTYTSRSNTLTMWNSSAGPNSPLVATPGNSTSAYQWAPSGTEDMSKNYDWNITLPTLPSGSSIQKVVLNDIVLLSTSVGSGFFGWGTNPYTVTALSLKPSSRGQILWQKSYDPPEGNISRSFGPLDPTNRVFTMVEKETMQWLGYDLDSGELLWGPTGDFRAFQYYGQVSNPPAPGHIAYGNLYVGGYGGELLCFDVKTGVTKWVYNNTYAGTESPWGLFPLFVAAIADGKVYCYTSEHSPNVPLYKGSKVRCIDAYTGEEKWTLSSWYAIGSFGQSPMPIADGYCVYLNVYDTQVYCIGKGPSAITVEAPLAGVTQGQSVIIQGKVTDESAGVKEMVAEGKFSSVAAMSDESMGQWMEYVYMQKPMPANATGVTVKIEAMGPNGFVTLGTATTDTSGLYSLEWTPDTPGKYTIIATFDATNSYYGSYDETAVSVNTAPTAPTATPTPTPTPTPTEEPTPTPTVTPSPYVETGTTDYTAVYVGVSAVIIIVVIAAIAIFLRRRK